MAILLASWYPCMLVGASLSEPHIDEFAVEFVYIIGASVSEPLSSDLNVDFVCLSWTVNLP